MQETTKALTKQVVVRSVPHGCQLRDRVKRGEQEVLDGPVLEEAVHLVDRHAESVPEEDGRAEDLDEERVEEHRSDLGAPDEILLPDVGSLRHPLKGWRAHPSQQKVEEQNFASKRN